MVGRTLSAYTTADVVNNELSITFTVYNDQADPISGVLLTDTLQSGVTFKDATRLPDRNGQELAWSLGTIQGFDRASVTLTVSLESGTLRIDSGVRKVALVPTYQSIRTGRPPYRSSILLLYMPSPDLQIQTPPHESPMLAVIQ